MGLYLLIVLTLAAASWGEDKFLLRYAPGDAVDVQALRVTAAVIKEQLRTIPVAQWPQRVAELARATGVNLELFTDTQIVGSDTVRVLQAGNIAYMQSSGGDDWALKQLDAGHVLALKAIAKDAGRSWVEWALTALFYAAIALVIMLWIWPLTRDLRVLERATTKYGDRNWKFEAPIKPGSQIFALAAAFRRMAVRIDGLIASHKDMSNAVSHEIKTPLARMQFEIELAQQAPTLAAVGPSLEHIKTDIGALDALVKATLNYAILERADLALNLDMHDFATLIPAFVDQARRDARPELQIEIRLVGAAGNVVCDVHLIETVLKNLLHNAIRYAQRQIRVTFLLDQGVDLEVATYDVRMDAAARALKLPMFSL